MRRLAPKLGFAVAVVVVIAIGLNSQSSNDIHTGLVTKVRDGDTIEVADLPVRLNGIAAPELDEPEGPEARDYMRDLVIGREVRCELNGERNYDRVIGICFLDGEDIGGLIISAGLARDCPKFSGGRYHEFNTDASRRLAATPAMLSGETGRCPLIGDLRLLYPQYRS
jgi:endonuclease YncB( thermonuclease family)